MIRYTVQVHIAGYAVPYGREVHHCGSLAAVRRLLQAEHEEAERVGAGYEPSTALIWRGEHGDVSDMYPDMQAEIGPRGGVTFTPC